MPHSEKQDIDTAIVSGLEAIGHAYRALLWEQAREHDLSPLQIQLLIHIREAQSVKISGLARHFMLTKPTVSEAIRSLERKHMIGRHKDPDDARSHSVRLTEWGADIAHIASFYTEPVRRIIAPVALAEKEILLKNIRGLLRRLEQEGAED
ncbi:MarR family winged helix-turn-helix transcriptional regulator [Taibaiella chishuiensis]|nr:MarR family winged helix-turn-helix transcriptional regulator [Taibaiella chishuiensis]